MVADLDHDLVVGVVRGKTDGLSDLSNDLILLRLEKAQGLCQLLDIFRKGLLFSLRVLGFFRLNVHQEATFPSRSHLWHLIHHVTNFTTVVSGRSIQVVPEEFATWDRAVSNHLLQAEVHGADDRV